MTTTTLARLSVPSRVESRALVPGPAAITAIAIVLAAWYLNAVISWRQAALFLVGAAPAWCCITPRSASRRRGACSFRIGAARACARRC